MAKGIKVLDIAAKIIFNALSINFGRVMLLQSSLQELEPTYTNALWFGSFTQLLYICPRHRKISLYVGFSTVLWWQSSVLRYHTQAFHSKAILVVARSIAYSLLLRIYRFHKLLILVDLRLTVNLRTVVVIPRVERQFDPSIGIIDKNTWSNQLFASPFSSGEDMPLVWLAVVHFVCLVISCILS